MGYWDAHPMAGDSPMDAEYGLTDLLFTEKEKEEDLHWDEAHYRVRLEEKLSAAADLHYYNEQQFILPFKVAEFGIQIQDTTLSKKIQAMIQDGGAALRGYPLTESTAENNYNGFQSPYDYARALYDHWDRGMEGSLDLTKIGTNIGLFEKILTNIDDNTSGLLNVD